MGPSFFIKRPRFAFVIAILTVLVGLMAGYVMPVDQYPDIAAEHAAPPAAACFASPAL